MRKVMEVLTSELLCQIHPLSIATEETRCPFHPCHTNEVLSTSLPMHIKGSKSGRLLFKKLHLSLTFSNKNNF